MSGVKEDKIREERIENEAIVDAYNEQEKAMGWYYCLENKISFPFLARCIVKRTISPLLVGDNVEVIGMAPEEECEHEVFVMIRRGKEGLAVPLSQLGVDYADDETKEAVEDWHYWVGRGYEF